MSTIVNGNSTSPKRKKSGRFNIIDFLLILIALAIVAAILYVFAPFSTVKNLLSSETKTIEYTVEIIGVDKAFINKIKSNDIVVDSVSKSQLGTVQATDYSNPYTVLQYVQKDGQPEGILVEHPNKCNVLVTISSTAKYVKEEGYYINHYRIAVGTQMQLIFPNYVGEANCIDISVVS